MTFRSQLAASAAILLAACQSVHTQVATPPPLDKPVSLSLNPAGATPKPTPTPAGSPVPAPPPRLSYSSVKGVGKTIAITFDDGPSAKLTPKLLDILKERNIKATFFVVGQNAAEYPDILRREVAEGHEIGNHSWSHPALTGLSSAGVKSQIERTNAAIRAATGHDPELIRPPYGATNKTLDRRFKDDYGFKVILWSVDPLDWKYRNSERVKRSILAQTQPGAIILVHDIHATSVAAMPDALDALLAQGYKFVTVSQLLAMEGGDSAKKRELSPSAEITVPAPTPYAVERYDSTSPATSDGSASQ